ncbi:MAG: class I SAM-dependent methyltransferase [Acidaminococcaceae bacterium]|nr:class I SAM-dependent methyltransferase [Acidaminococcaceae bacterium]
MTIAYYDNYAKEYADLTVNADMSKQYAKFMAYLPTGASILDVNDGDVAKRNVKSNQSIILDVSSASRENVARGQVKILDAGCGSGRDSLYFMKKGYAVTMLDASAEMCKCAERLTGQKALHMQFEDINFENRFDGIWACASLLHVPEKKLETIFEKFWRALKDNGILYASWKYGELERYDGERFYCDMTGEKLKNVLARAITTKHLQNANLFSETYDCAGDANLFECLDCWVAEDVLPLDREQKWLNVVLRKSY